MPSPTARIRIALTFAVITLGVAVCTSIGSTVAGALLRPFSLPSNSPLLVITRHQGGQSLPLWSGAHIENAARTIDGNALLAVRAFRDTIELPARFAGTAAEVRGDLRQFGQYRVLMGRTFDTGDFQNNSEWPVLLTERCWRTRFHGDRSILGVRGRVGGGPARVIGIVAEVPRAIRLLAGEEPDILVPARADAAWRHPNNAIYWLLSNGPTPPDTHAEPLNDWLLRPYRPALLLLSILWLALILLTASSLTSIHAATLASESKMAWIRMALGAPGHRWWGRPLVELALCATAAFPFGWAGAIALKRAVEKGWVASGLPTPVAGSLTNLEIGTMAASLLAALSILAGVPSAWATWALVRGAAHTRVHRWRLWMCSLQVGLAFLLLVTGIQIFRRLEWHLDRVGYQTAGITKIKVTVPANVGSPETWNRTFHRILSRVRAVPGVTAVTTCWPLPSQPEMARQLHISGRPAQARVRHVRPEFFQVTSARLLDGQIGTVRDSDVVVNRSFALAHWGASSPLGRTLESGGQTHRVIAVVADQREDLLDDRPLPAVYLFRPNNWNYILARTTNDATGLAHRMAALAAEVEPNLTIDDAGAWDDSVAGRSTPVRARGRYLTILGLVCLLLATMGTGATLLMMARDRQRDLAIRVCLGCVTFRLVRDEAVRLTRVLIIGIAAGACGMTALFTAMPVELGKPLPIAVATATAVVAIALALSAIPVTRALTRLNPAGLLRQQ